MTPTEQIITFILVTEHDEDGLGLKITESGSARDDGQKGNKKIFVNGILSYTRDKNNNQILMSYNTNEP